MSCDFDVLDDAFSKANTGFEFPGIEERAVWSAAFGRNFLQAPEPQDFSYEKWSFLLIREAGEREGNDQEMGRSSGSVGGSFSGEKDTEGNSRFRGEIGINKEFDHGRVSGKAYGEGRGDSSGEFRGAFGGEVKAEFSF